MKFLLGMIFGIGLSSVVWALYIAYFLEDAADLGRRIREWVQRKRR